MATRSVLFKMHRNRVLSPDRAVEYGTEVMCHVEKGRFWALEGA